MGRIWGTLSARVIALSAVMTLAIIALAFTLTYISATRILEQETSEVVDAELRGLLDSFDSGGPVELATTIQQRARADADAVYLLAHSHLRSPCCRQWSSMWTSRTRPE